jgi:WD40 repeat protein
MSTSAIWLLDPQSTSISAIDIGHSDRATAAVATSSGERIVSGSEDGTVRVWNRADGRLERVYRMSDQNWNGKRVGDLAISADGKVVIASSSWSGPLRIWAIDSDQSARTLGDAVDYSIAMALTADGSRLFLGGHFTVHQSMSDIHVNEHSEIRVWDLREGRLAEVLRGHHKHILSTVLCNQDRTLVTASADKTVRIWDVDIARQFVPERARHLHSSVSQVVLHASGKSVLGVTASDAMSFEMGIFARAARA